MRTKARSVVVVAFEELELLDPAAPLEVLSVAGRRWNFRPYKVSVVAAQRGLVSTRNQLRIEATQTFAETAPAEIVLIPGGYGARKLADDGAALVELARFAKDAELLAAVGNGVLPLLRAGLLGNEKVALGSELSAELCQTLGAEQRVEAGGVVESGRIVSARASSDALKLALTIVGRTMGPKLVSMVAADLGLEPEAQAPRVEIKY
jgi:transcriptional regulator GlxA family with amidase domain